MTIYKGTNLIAGTAPTPSAAIDNTSVTLNASNKVQASGYIDKNSGNAKYNWIGTLAQYEALETYNNNWLYYITDDEPATFTIDDSYSKYVTNCITNIPQDIKLELNNGTLTLKAGSKVYVPNGFEQDETTPKFDMVIIENDITTSPQVDGQYLLFYQPLNNQLTSANISVCFSGTNIPSTGDTIYYHTSNNTLGYYSNGSLVAYRSFPIALSTISNNVFSSIDQVFNGFGYIGSTVFALPGIEGLIPNGRNLDGSLNNIKAHTENVLTYTNTTSEPKWFSFVTPTNNVWTQINYKGDEALSIGTPSEYWYFDTQANLWLYNGSSSCKWLDFAHALINNSSPYNITSINTKKVFKVLDWNDNFALSRLSMPSNKYLDLTLLASGQSYTAPANGYFYVRKKAGANGSQIGIYGNNLSIEACTQYSTNTANIYLPVCKGDAVTISYTVTGATEIFRFVYAVGSENGEV